MDLLMWDGWRILAFLTYVRRQWRGGRGAWTQSVLSTKLSAVGRGGKRQKNVFCQTNHGGMTPGPRAAKGPSIAGRQADRAPGPRSPVDRGDLSKTKMTAGAAVPVPRPASAGTTMQESRLISYGNSHCHHFLEQWSRSLRRSPRSNRHSRGVCI